MPPGSASLFQPSRDVHSVPVHIPILLDDDVPEIDPDAKSDGL